MSASLALLESIGSALADDGLDLLLAGEPLGERLVDVAGKTLVDWGKRRSGREQEAELEALARSGVGDLRREAGELAERLVPGPAGRERQALLGYLLQVPSAVRQGLRRPSDPSGKTLPTGLRLRRPEDLLAFLPARLPRFQPGDRPPGRGDWELVELLGTGGFGEVWRAHNALAGQQAAFKFCLDAEAARSLLNEAQMLARVRQAVGQHPGIVHLLDTSLSSDPPFLVYELVEGGDLAGLIQEWRRAGGPRPEQVSRLVLRLAETIGFTHRLSPQIVHRDLKPANVLVQRLASRERQRPEEENFTLRVADFGIGAVAARRELALSGRGMTGRSQVLATVVRGSFTPLYASPQQARGEPPDVRDDVHALGVIWYQMLTGDLESGAPTGLDWADELRKKGMSEPLVRLLGSCVSARAEARPADAQALADQLKAALRPAVLEALPVPAAAPAAIPLGPPAAAPAPVRWPAPEPILEAQLAGPVRATREPAPAPPANPIRQLRPLIICLAIGLGVVVVGAFGLMIYFLTRPSDRGKGVEVSGRVILNKQYVGGATVQFWKRGSSGGGATLVQRVETGRDGRFHTRLAPDTYTVTVSGPGVPSHYSEVGSTKLTYAVHGPKATVLDIELSGWGEGPSKGNGAYGK
jgi:serine/threonine protein kinase